MRLLLALLFVAQIATAQNTPNFLQEYSQASERSNAAHWWVSCGGTFLLGETYSCFTDNKALSTIGAGLTMFTIGWLKEDVWDGRMKRGVRSGGDKFINGMGCLAGMMAFRVKLDIKEKKEIKKYEKYFEE